MGVGDVGDKLLWILMTLITQGLIYIVQCDDLLAAQVRGPNPGTWRSRRSTTAEQLPRNQWGGRVFGNFCDSQYILTTESKDGFNF